MSTGATTTAASSSDPAAADLQLPSKSNNAASDNSLTGGTGVQESVGTQDESTAQQNAVSKAPPADGGSSSQSPVELDEFGLPIRVRSKPSRPTSDSSEGSEVFHEAADQIDENENPGVGKEEKQTNREESTSNPRPQSVEQQKPGDELTKQIEAVDDSSNAQSQESNANPIPVDSRAAGGSEKGGDAAKDVPAEEKPGVDKAQPEEQDKPLNKEEQPQTATAGHAPDNEPHKRHSSVKPSEWSHQGLMLHHDSEEESDEEDEDTWKAMPALGEFDVYDDYGRLVARGAKQDDDEAVYQGLGGAGKGYTRVQLDEDAHSVTSMDEDTSYLFKENGHTVGVDEELRDATSQLQATKDLLTEGQRIAYVGVTRLSIYQMDNELRNIVTTRGSKKALQGASDSIKKWGQMMMARLYAHMDIDTAEQIMIEQLAEHGVQPADLVRPLMQNARVKNPMAEEELNSPKKSASTPTSPGSKGPRASLSTPTEASFEISSPPPYEEHKNDELPEVRTPSQLPTSENIDIDLRWTILCDLFLVLIADSSYDSRSRRLLERVGEAMEVPWVQICRFEKRVIDALEMQEENTNSKETWDEADNMEHRRKMALKKKYMIMGLATVGGGLVIGLSAGLLAPVIGAGLAAGLTTVGISGTSAFLGGAGGTALIASGATLTGSTIGIRASHRRTGAVKTFEYRPLHNNKRVNLIVTVSGWMTGKVDDVRLPFSTVDPIMGDLYSVLWEPEMLRSMGDTINILATEALTQGLQQVLGSTVLVALMASLQLPIVLTKLSYLIDNPWNVSLVRANAAGLILADSLMARNLGNRPVTLLGFSLGARVIFSCLKELANKGAYGLVQNVYLFGSPVVAKKDEYLRARSVISGRFVNGFASNDWILGYLFRATSGGIMQIAGLAPVQGIPGLENIDVTNLVNGHMAYRAAMPRILREVGWEVISDEFAEIEDPDPENHAERQRELIREIDEARREAEQKPEKKRFGFFKRGKLAEKKAWETYDPNKSETGSRDSIDSSSTRAGSVLFDIDAIRAELAGEQIEVKQLESTLPPMKVELDTSSKPSSPATAERPASMQHSKSADASLPVPKTPTSPDKKSPHDLYSHPEDDEVHMTFDTAYNGHDQHSPFSKPHDDFSSPPPSRPGIHSSATMPAAVGFGAGAAVGGAIGLGLEENAWAQDEFGHGGDDEIQMTFE